MGVNHPKDRPWIIRTYGGYGTARQTNELYRNGLADGQTGLSVAFDLPTQTGYDSDNVMAAGEVGKVGVPISHIEDMRTLFDQIPLAEMNTSMTINATAAWLLALYVAVADEHGADRKALRGTTQNDILKEYLSRGTFIFPPEASIRLTADTIEFTGAEVPKWNPVNVCSYHLQEAGADPVLEVAQTLADAVCYLDAVRDRGALTPQLVGSISFFCNAGIRFVEEVAKMRAFTHLWDRITRERYGVNDERFRRFRYGVQVNSLGLTAVQPENNAYRIFLEMLAVTLSKEARARSVQLPAWNEALGLPRAWDQQWSRRAQQILAYESDLLEYDDIFEGSKVVEEKTREIEEGAWDEYETILGRGGSVNAIDYMKEKLVAAHAKRVRAIESGEMTIIGVNAETRSEPSPLVGEGDFHIVRVTPEEQAEQIERLERFRGSRDKSVVAKALDALKQAASAGENVMPPSIEAAKAGVTTGEWADALRDVFGTYRAPTGVTATSSAGTDAKKIAEARKVVGAIAKELGVGRIRILVGKPGLDGHSNAAEQIAVRARDLGMEAVYPGIRLTPAEIAQMAADEDVHLIGLSVLSGAHDLLVPEVLEQLRQRGVDPGRVPVVVGGTIPDDDARKLLELGIARVFTPRDYDLTRNLTEVVELLSSRNGER
ncbi:MAG TPA: protein meaA [Actinomycetota bacterium]|jgi:(2R)-ethylmalonyl-CoA mutase|nr:protein meaA [Actinomycetota bacterium]